VSEAIDAAIGSRDPETTTRDVRIAQCDLIAARRVRLPGRFRKCRGDPDARGPSTRRATRILRRRDDLGAEASAPLHDHAGSWCMDGVIEGAVRVHRYELLVEENDLCRFAARDTVEAGTGEAGALIPPFEHHVIEKPRSDRIAMTLHVYGGDMSRYSIFLPESGTWFRPTTESSDPILGQNAVLTPTYPERHLIGVEVAIADWLGRRKPSPQRARRGPGFTDL
jgi:hypothetical protein